MFTQRAVSNFQFVRKHPRYANLVAPYEEGQTIILFYFLSTSKLCLDYLPRFTVFARESKAFTALVTQEYADTHFPELVLQNNVITDDFTLSALLPEQLIPTVAIFNSRGKLYRTIHSGDFSLRGCLSYQANGYVKNYLSELLLRMNAFEQKYTAIRLSAELQRKRVFRHLCPVPAEFVCYKRSQSAPRLRSDFSLLLTLGGKDITDKADPLRPTNQIVVQATRESYPHLSKQAASRSCYSASERMLRKTPRSESVRIGRTSHPQDLQLHEMVASMSKMTRNERRFQRYDKEYIWNEASFVRDLSPRRPLIRHLSD